MTSDLGSNTAYIALQSPHITHWTLKLTWRHHLFCDLGQSRNTAFNQLPILTELLSSHDILENFEQICTLLMREEKKNIWYKLFLNMYVAFSGMLSVQSWNTSYMIWEKNLLSNKHTIYATSIYSFQNLQLSKWNIVYSYCKAAQPAFHERLLFI